VIPPMSLFPVWYADVFVASRALISKTPHLCSRKDEKITFCLVDGSISKIEVTRSKVLSANTHYSLFQRHDGIRL
jgi:hypothetical protein